MYSSHSPVTIRSSQCCPVSPLGQEQTYEESVLKHLPPFVHGELRHGLKVAKIKQNKVIFGQTYEYDSM